MRQIVLEQYKYKTLTDTDDYIYGPYVDRGKIFIWRAVTVTHTNILATDWVGSFVDKGGVIIYTSAIQSPVDGGYATIGGRNFPLGEGMRYGVYCPGADAGEIITMNVFGELWDIEHWRNIGMVSPEMIPAL